MPNQRRHRRWRLAVLVAACAALQCAGQQAITLPQYIPRPVGSGVIRSWGDDAMGNMMKTWEKAFQRYHPGIAFKSTLDGSGTGMAGIITGTSEMTLMGRPATANEVMGFEWVFRYRPLAIQIMSGGVRGEGKSPALAVFVGRDNPLRQMDMTTLAAILGCPEGPTESVTWATAGLKGVWRTRPIHAYIYDSQTGTGAFLQHTVLGTRDGWNWAIVREFKDIIRANGTTYSAGEQTVDALKHDPDGLAVSTMDYQRPWARALAIAASDSAERPTSASVIEAKYPFVRGLYVYVNRKPGAPMNPILTEFLRFVLSEEGQRLVYEQRDFLPLNAATDRAQLEKLN